MNSIKCISHIDVDRTHIHPYRTTTNRESHYGDDIVGGVMGCKMPVFKLTSLSMMIFEDIESANPTFKQYLSDSYKSETNISKQEKPERVNFLFPKVIREV